VAVIGRLFFVFFAYVLACIAASAVFTFGTLNPHWQDVVALGLPPAAVWAIVVVGAPIIGAAAFVPAAAIVAVTESFAWRSVLLYAAVGGALALALSYGLDMPGDIGDPATYFVHEREVLAAAGIAGGLVYWLLAGRRAGAWKRDSWNQSA
jgi:hypothetical protein